MPPPGRVLVIAGSDSSGGAGLEADQKVLAAYGCYAMTATTALTAQNTQAVHDVFVVPPAFLRKQIDACLGDVGADVVKIGMLASAETVGTVARALADHGVQKVVLDPVMVATTGTRLLPRDALRELRIRLLPGTTVVTPNMPEAEMMLDEAGVVVDGLASGLGFFESLARSLLSLGPDWVLLKGGHRPLRADYTFPANDSEKAVVIDVLVGRDGGTPIVIETPYQNSKNTHGTGCALASAVAANLSKGWDVPRSVKTACRYVEAGIKTAPNLGRGNGPLNHFHSTYMLPFAPGRFVEYLLERPDVAPVWDRFVHHPFVLALGDGTLPLESFTGYLVQDYLYLTHFARAHALASYKAQNMANITAAANIVLHIARETRLHIKYCQQFGLSKADMDTAPEKEACTAYTRYVLDVGMSEDGVGLQVALAPCLLGYGVIAAQLHASTRSKRGRDMNLYWEWVENYVAEDYVQAVKMGSDLLEKHAVLQSPSRIESLVQIFIHATKANGNRLLGNVPPLTMNAGRKRNVDRR